MRFRCVDEKKPVPYSFSHRGTIEEKYTNITVGREYEGTIFPSVTGKIREGYGDITTEHVVLVIDDAGEWQSLPIKLFVPATPC